MTRLSNEHSAINLSQGFPDFDGPPRVVEAAREALASGHNQYARSMGHPLLVETIAAKVRSLYGLEYDAGSEVVVFSGATEGIASFLLGFLDPGDEVILFEPFYDSYPAVIAMAGAVPRYTTLRFPDFALDVAELESLFSDRTRLIVLNTPHNPTGKVFNVEELSAIARLAAGRGVVVLADEVYEHLTYDGLRHVPIATLPGMRERTFTVSSAGKTFSLTGWKIGWGTGPVRLVQAAQAAHQFITFSTATPLQVAVAGALREHDADYFDALRREYTARRDFIVEALGGVGFQVAVPRGTYFVTADFSRLSREDDRSFAVRLVKEHGVAAIPPSVFYKRRPEEGRSLLRFAFSKRMETLGAAASRLRGLRPYA
ncbi:MAG TPA: aminotransferase class I/II-fold pyridoxal phosphate-dependent enzyme [Planctomycetota bacterium]|nr:aminotransferase class I/II-fold pyridoxal phosphate-dependent enzyme [Planctomycetota bacterium]